MALTKGYEPGWAAGTTDGGEWLTIWGSAFAHRVYTTREEAQARAEEIKQLRAASVVVVRRVQPTYHPGVTVTQTAYKIVPAPGSEN